MSEHDAVRDSATTGRGGAAGEQGQRMRPLPSFFLLVGLLALILSIGYAVAPDLSQPVGYAPVANRGTTPTGIQDSGGSGRGSPCAGPGCAGATTGGATEPFAGGGSTLGRPAFGTLPPVATIAMPPPNGAASIQLTLNVAGGKQAILVPAPLAASPLLAELVKSYLRCWRERGRSYALADPAPLRGVLVEPALSEATGRIERLRAEGRVQWFEDGHAITILAIEGEWAWLIDEYIVGIGAAPSPHPSASPQQSSSPTPGWSSTPTVAPPLRERVRATFTLKRVDGVWKIADSASVPVR